jgi:mitochondrial translocator assembly and maintenance protein 41
MSFKSTILDEELFPPVLFALAYGSGAVAQSGYDPAERPMLDLVLVVDDPLEWHRLNFVGNFDHYSLVASLGPRTVASIQSLSAGVYYNTLTPMKGESQKGRLMKYGVVSLTDFRRDLKEWGHLYLAGRMHKPVVFFGNPPSIINDDIISNLSSAVRTGLLFLPEFFSKEEFFLTIANLSYHGDFRMLFGENPDKVQNIVRPNLDKFESLYTPVIQNEFSASLHWQGDHGLCQQDMSSTTRCHHASLLPQSVRPISGGGMVDVVGIRSQLRSVVFRSSVSQSAKGIFTAGPAKSATYVSSKIGKWALWWARRAF